jgi:hypothetical protein
VNITNPTYLGYSVVLQNAGGSTASNSRYTAEIPMGATDVTVAGTAGTPPPTCTLSANTVPVVLDCPIGQLKSQQSRPAFYVYFRLTNPLDGNLVQFTGTTFYAEGKGPNAIPTNSSETWTARTVTLSATEGASAASIVAPFQAVTLVTNVFDNSFGTKVGVPSSNEHAVAFVTEAIEGTAAAGTCSSLNLLFCPKVTLNIKRLTSDAKFTPFLDIDMHIDALQIRAGTQVGNLKIDYYADNGALLYTDVQNIPCDVDAQGKPVAKPIGPCLVTPATHYKSKGVKGWTPQLDGDMILRILNQENGTYVVR